MLQSPIGQTPLNSLAGVSQDSGHTARSGSSEASRPDHEAFEAVFIDDQPQDPGAQGDTERAQATSSANEPDADATNDTHAPSGQRNVDGEEPRAVLRETANREQADSHADEWLWNSSNENAHDYIAHRGTEWRARDSEAESFAPSLTGRDRGIYDVLAERGAAPIHWNEQAIGPALVPDANDIPARPEVGPRGWDQTASDDSALESNAVLRAPEIQSEHSPHSHRDMPLEFLGRTVAMSNEAAPMDVQDAQVFARPANERGGWFEPHMARPGVSTHWSLSSEQNEDLGRRSETGTAPGIGIASIARDQTAGLPADGVPGASDPLKSSGDMFVSRQSQAVPQDDAAPLAYRQGLPQQIGTSTSPEPVAPDAGLATARSDVSRGNARNEESGPTRNAVRATVHDQVAPAGNTFQAPPIVQAARTVMSSHDKTLTGDVWLKGLERESLSLAQSQTLTSTVETSSVQRQAGQNILTNADLPRHVAQQLATGFRAASDKAADIFLNPAELGRVRISLQSAETGIVVSILADRPETLDLLRRHVDLLAQDFHEMGYGSAEFSFGKGQDSDTQNAFDHRADTADVTEQDLPRAVQAPGETQSGVTRPAIALDRVDLRL